MLSSGVWVDRDAISDFTGVTDSIARYLILINIGSIFFRWSVFCQHFDSPNTLKILKLLLVYGQYLNISVQTILMSAFCNTDSNTDHLTAALIIIHVMRIIPTIIMVLVVKFNRGDTSRRVGYHDVYLDNRLWSAWQTTF